MKTSGNRRLKIRRTEDTKTFEKDQSPEQRLIDITFHIGLMIKNTPHFLHKLTDYELTEWIRTQLKECGYPTIPVGSSWGILQEKENV